MYFLIALRTNASIFKINNRGSIIVSFNMFSNKSNIILFMVLFLLTAACTSSINEEEVTSQPNIIMFVLDDLNDWVNPLGYEQVNIMIDGFQNWKDKGFPVE